jgi:hypothetical protein
VPRREIAALVALAVGIACLAGAAVHLVGARYPPGPFGATAPQAESPSASTPTARSRRPIAASRLGDPVALAIPALGVAARVTPVTSTGSVLAVPVDARIVGWWVSSARPGASTGSVVMDGHVDSATQGLGALFGLTGLRIGDRLVVSTTTQQVAYRVIGRRVFSKTPGLPRELFETSTAARLVVISCGGPFDRRTGSYEDNVVVFAVPD